ncbi:energy transducer TonB [Aurantivibrio plasticivorans]
MWQLLIRLFAAMGITLGIFLGMRYLIIPDMPNIVEPPETPPISVTREMREQQQKEEDDLTPDQVKHVAPPPPPPLTRDQVEVDNATDSGLGLEVPPVVISEHGTNIDQNRRAIPVVNIPPEYPVRELAKKREGWVMLEFTITELGAVEDVVVIDEEPKGSFAKAAMRALTRWKYQPKMAEGKPVAQYGMRELFSFRLTE